MNASNQVLAVLGIALASTLASPLARADISLSAVGILNLSNGTVSPSLPNGNTLGTGTTFGFGLLGSMSVFTGFSLELGALYVPREINTNDVNGNNIAGVTSTNLEFPLLLRYTGLPIVSFGAGPYYAYATGSLTIAQPGQPNTSVSYSAAQVSQSDYGLEASVAASYPLFPMCGITGDLRYLLGLANLDSSGATTKHFRDFQFLLGLNFSI